MKVEHIRFGTRRRTFECLEFVGLTFLIFGRAIYFTRVAVYLFKVL